jgi:hypothetical protein
MKTTFDILWGLTEGIIVGALAGAFAAFMIHWWHLYFSKSPTDVEYRENRKWWRAYKKRIKKRQDIILNREYQRDKDGNLTALRHTFLYGKKVTFGKWDDNLKSESKKSI